MDYDEWRSILAVDLDGPFMCAQRAGRRMASQGGGRVINVTGVHPDGLSASYVTGASLFVDGGLVLLGPQAAGALTSADWRQG
jgi:NAD(P)-dependent dehydrogenase (short-subunit alcohol dehydrogenase family)